MDICKKYQRSHRFLGGEKPTPLTEMKSMTILNDLEEKKKGVVQKHNIEVGDKVKITDGVFVNFIGTVQEVFHDKGRLSVLVSIFGEKLVLMISSSGKWKKLVPLKKY